MLAALGIEIGIAMCQMRLGRDLFLVNSLVYAILSVAKGAHHLPELEPASPMVVDIFNVVGIASIIVCVWLTIKTASILHGMEGADFHGARCSPSGLSFYFYEALAGMTNPPMEWGYPRTVEGFWHALTRGQYDKVSPTDIFSDPHRFFTELGMLVRRRGRRV